MGFKQNLVSFLEDQTVERERGERKREKKRKRKRSRREEEVKPKAKRYGTTWNSKVFV